MQVFGLMLLAFFIVVGIAAKIIAQNREVKIPFCKVHDARMEVDNAGKAFPCPMCAAEKRNREVREARAFVRDALLRQDPNIPIK